MTEAQLTKKVKKRCEAVQDLYWYKVSDRFLSGVPDIYMIYQGQSAHIELKATGKKPRDLQAYTMGKIRRAGGLAVWFNDYEKFDHWFSRWLTGCPD